jgi:hypothetical protein
MDDPCLAALQNRLIDCIYSCGSHRPVWILELGIWRTVLEKQ